MNFVCCNVLPCLHFFVNYKHYIDRTKYIKMLQNVVANRLDISFFCKSIIIEMIQFLGFASYIALICVIPHTVGVLVTRSFMYGIANNVLIDFD